MPLREKISISYNLPECLLYLQVTLTEPCPATVFVLTAFVSEFSTSGKRKRIQFRIPSPSPIETETTAMAKGGRVGIAKG